MGLFNKDLPNGYGIYKWSKEKSYEGSFKDGKPHGRGKLILEDG